MRARGVARSKSEGLEAQGLFPSPSEEGLRPSERLLVLDPNLKSQTKGEGQGRAQHTEGEVAFLFNDKRTAPLVCAAAMGGLSVGNGLHPYLNITHQNKLQLE